MMLYCRNQRQQERMILDRDILVVSNTSTLLESAMSRVRRVVVDESHEVLKNSPVSKFVHNLGKYPNVDFKWLVSGTPFGSSELINDPVFTASILHLGSYQLQTWEYPSL